MRTLDELNGAVAGRRIAGRVLPLVAGTALVVSGCGGASGTAAGGTGKPADGKTFTMAVGSDPGSLDPARTLLSIAIGVGKFLYDPLVHLDDKGQPVAGLAQTWQATAQKATFTLRAGIKCADGSPLTAGDVAANINYVGDAKNKSPLAGLMIMPGTTAKGDDAARTVTLNSGAPDPFLLRNAGSVPIVCGKGMADRASLAAGGNGTGMFTMTEAVANDHYTLTRRKDYAWGPATGDQKGLPDKVKIRVIPNESTAANLLLSGELNAASVFGPEQQRLNARKLFHADMQAPVGEIFFNQNAGRPGADEKVRRALVQGLDLTSLGKVLTNGTGKPSQGMVTLEPRACTGDSVTGNLPGQDLTAAKAGLDAAGWVAGADGVRAKGGKKLKLSVLYGTQLGPTMASGAELVQKAWKDLGVQVSFKPVDSPALSSTLFGSGDWDVSMGPVGVTAPNQLVPLMSGATPPKGVNFAGVHNAEYESLVKAASAQVGTAGCPQWQQAETALVKKVDAVPYFNSTQPFFGQGTRFRLSQGAIVPSSIRMYA